VLRQIDRQAPLPPGLLMIGGRTSLIEQTFEELTSSVNEMIDRTRPSAVPDSRA
jgi:hypothetical protein